MHSWARQGFHSLQTLQTLCSMKPIPLCLHTLCATVRFGQSQSVLSGTHSSKAPGNNSLNLWPPSKIVFQGSPHNIPKFGVLCLVHVLFLHKPCAPNGRLAQVHEFCTCHQAQQTLLGTYRFGLLLAQGSSF